MTRKRKHLWHRDHLGRAKMKNVISAFGWNWWWFRLHVIFWMFSIYEFVCRCYGSKVWEKSTEWKLVGIEKSLLWNYDDFECLCCLRYYHFHCVARFSLTRGIGEISYYCLNKSRNTRKFISHTKVVFVGASISCNQCPLKRTLKTIERKHEIPGKVHGAKICRQKKIIWSSPV